MTGNISSAVDRQMKKRPKRDHAAQNGPTFPSEIWPYRPSCVPVILTRFHRNGSLILRTARHHMFLIVWELELSIFMILILHFSNKFFMIKEIRMLNGMFAAISLNLNR